jgi:hypothetical protein
MNAHRALSGTCLAVDPQGIDCWCNEFLPSDEMAALERVRIIRAQIAGLREMLREAQSRGLLPEEELAFWELSGAFAELNKAWREVFGE